MSRFQIPRGKEFFSWPPAIALFAVAAFFLLSGAIRIAIRERQFTDERKKLEARLEALKAEKARLESEISRTQSPEAVERLAKERLNLKKPGEEVVVVQPPAAPDHSAEPKRWLPAWVMHLFGR